MDAFIIDLIERAGYFGIFVLMMLENIIPPIPSEVIMGLGGVMVERGSMDFWPLLLAGTLGTLIGQYAWFMVGERLGYRRLRPLVDRWGRWLTMEWEDVERLQQVLYKHGHWIVFFMRFSPFARTMISLPAGMAKMPRGKFILFTVLPSLIWNVLLISGGHLLSQFAQESQYLITGIAGFFLALAVGGYLWRLARWKPRAQR